VFLKSAWGIKQGNRYNYINTLTYDEFGQRRHVDYGNGVNSEYTYDDFTRRLDTLTTGRDGTGERWDRVLIH